MIQQVYALIASTWTCNIILFAPVRPYEFSQQNKNAMYLSSRMLACLSFLAFVELQFDLA
jgi:hypothetical protein